MRNIHMGVPIKNCYSLQSYLW